MNGQMSFLLFEKKQPITSSTLSLYKAVGVGGGYFFSNEVSSGSRHEICKLLIIDVLTKRGPPRPTNMFLHVLHN